MTTFFDPQDRPTAARMTSIAGMVVAALMGATACTTSEEASESFPTTEESEETPSGETEDSQAPEELPDSDAAANEQALTASDLEEGDQVTIPALDQLGGTAEVVAAGPADVDVRLDDADLSSLEPVYGLRATGQRKFNPTTDQVCAGVEVPGLPDGIEIYQVYAADGDPITGDMNPGSAPAVIACSTNDDLEEVTERMLDEAASAPDRTMYLYIPYEHIEKQ